MQEVLENAQKQAQADKSKNMHKNRNNPDEIKEQIPVNAVVGKGSGDPKSYPEEPASKQTVQEPATEPKESSKLPVVDATLQTSPSPLDRQKLLTPSKFRNQTTSVAIQTEILK